MTCWHGLQKSARTVHCCITATLLLLLLLFQIYVCSLRFSTCAVNLF